MPAILHAYPKLLAKPGQLDSVLPARLIIQVQHCYSFCLQESQRFLLGSGSCHCHAVLHKILRRMALAARGVLKLLPGLDTLESLHYAVHWRRDDSLVLNTAMREIVKNVIDFQAARCLI